MKIATLKAQFEKLKYAFISAWKYTLVGLNQLAYYVLSFIDNFGTNKNEYKYKFKRFVSESKDNSIDFLANTRLLHNKQFIRAFISLIAVLVILSQSFSWLYDEYIGSGAEVTLGSIYHEVNQYDQNGDLIAADSDTAINIVYETNVSNMTKNSKFIEVKNVGTLDMEFSLAFSVESSVSGVTGLMYYRVYEVTDDVLATALDGSYSTRLQTYAHKNPISSSIETDTDVPISNMSTLNNLVKIDDIYKSDNEEENSKYYRIDYGMYSVANTSNYSGESFSIHLDVYSSQIGTISNSNSVGQVWEVSTEAQFREVLISALAGDTIKLIDNIAMDGSVNISKRINIDTNDYTLTISGDLIYDFMNTGDLLIDCSGTGVIKVGNDLTINTPKAHVTLRGENTSYDMVVGGEAEMNAIQSGEEDGLFFDNIKIVKSPTTLIPLDITLCSNTRLTTGKDVVLGTISGKKGSTNIEIINNGTITQLKFDEMSLLTTFTKAQIYVYNLGDILGIAGSTSIVLPSNATPYLGPNNGNTLIVKGITSGDITISGSSNFNSGNLNDDLDKVNVVPIDGEDDAYYVYIKTAEDSVEGVLRDYFTELGNSNPDNNISKIKKLIIQTINAQYFENEDFDFLKSDSIPVLNYLSLENCKIINDTTQNQIKKDAMSGKTSLTHLILPKNVTSILAGAFEDCPLGTIDPADLTKFMFLTIPNTVTSIGSDAFNAAKYVKFYSNEVPNIATGAFDTTGYTRIFVPDGIIDEFRDNDKLNEAYIYRNADLDDTGRYFIYDYTTGKGIAMIISTYVNVTSYQLPNTVTYQGSSYTVTGLGPNSYRQLNFANDQTVTISGPVTITDVGDYAFYNLKINGFTFNNVKTIGNYAFYNNKFTSITANNISTIGDYAFYNTTADSLSLSKAESIGKYAFAHATNMFSMTLGDVSYVGDYAFTDSPNVAKVYLTSTDILVGNGEENINIDVGTDAMFSGWGSYIDGRLRVYVPVGSTENGNSYLSLYQKKFSEYSKYIYISGTETGTYYHIGVVQNLSQFTVRQVTIAGTTGWEIISYQGADLSDTYEMPLYLTVNGKTQNVISIGDYAYANAKITGTGTIPIINDQLLNIGAHAFEGLGITKAEANSVLTIGDYAFSHTQLLEAQFLGLTTLGSRAISNVDTLAHLELGPVNYFGDGAISDNKSLEQLFLSDTSMNIQITGTPFENIGSDCGSRLRIYVPDDETIISYYKLLMSNYADYIYAQGLIVGSFVNDPIDYDIGEYSVRDYTTKNADGDDVTAWEIIEYHGADFDNTYKFPETLSERSIDTSYTVDRTGGWGANQAYVSTYDFKIYNNSDVTIKSYSFVIPFATGTSLFGLYGGGGALKYTIENNAMYVTCSTDNEYQPQCNIAPGGYADITAQLNHTIVGYMPEMTNISATSNSILQKPIISVGSNAYSHVETVESNTFDLSSNNLLNISDKAFGSIAGVKNVSFPNVITIGVDGFRGNSMITADFENIQTVKTGAFSDCPRLNQLDLHKVRTLQANSITDDPYLLRVFFDYYDASSTGIAANFDRNTFNNIGASTGDRFRFYVVSGSGTDNIEYYQAYAAAFDSKYTSYFYPYDGFSGTFTLQNTNIDIGQFGYRIVNKRNSMNGNIQGVEIIEYHGSSLDENYSIPTSLTVNNQTYPVISLGDYSYKHITSTGEFSIDNSIILNIGTQAFYGLDYLKNVTFDQLVSIGDEAFRNSGISEGYFEKMTSAGSYAFANCNSLHRLDLGMLKSLSDGLLYYDRYLFQLFLGSTTAINAQSKMDLVIGTDTFTNVGASVGDYFRIYVPTGNATTSLTYVQAYKNTLPSSMTDYIYETGEIVGSFKPAGQDFDIGEYTMALITRSNAKGLRIVDYHGNTLGTDYTVPNTYTVSDGSRQVFDIGANAYRFAVSSEPTAVTIPDSIQIIGNYAFYNTSVQSVRGSNLTSIGSYAFADLDYLKSVYFGNINTIGDHAFYNCPELNLVTLGNISVSIGDQAFYTDVANSSLESFYINSTTPPTISTNTLPTDLEHNITVYVPYNSVTTYENTNIWKNYFIKGIGTISGDFVYDLVDNEAKLVSYTNSSATSVTIPETVSITGVSRAITSVAANAFDGSAKLEQLTINANLKTIDDEFLNDNKSIKNIYVSSSNTMLSSQSGILYDKAGATLIKYPPARSDEAFSIQAYTKVIASYAFTNAGNLKSLTFNNDLTAISEDAFIDCYNLKRFVFTSNTPPYLLGYNTFTIYSDTVFVYPNETSVINRYNNSLYYYKYRNNLS